MSTVYELQRELGLPGFYLLVTAVVVLLLTIQGLLLRQGHRAAARVLAGAGLLIALAGVLGATLRPIAPWGTAVPRLILDPVTGAEGWAGRIAWRPVVDNVGLFVPLGALAPAAVGPRVPRLLLWFVLVALSVGIEGFQYLVPSGRVANAADVVANAAGAGIGLTLHALFAPWRERRRAREPAARR